MSETVCIGLSCIVNLAMCAATAQAVGFENHRIMARGVVDQIPEPLAPLFAEYRLAFVERAVEPGAVWPDDPTRRRCRGWHRVSLDLEATDRSRAARMDAAAHFPRTRAGARELYRRHHVRLGGSLPWEVERLYRELVTAFREADEAEVIRAAGHLVYFAGECASPFSATVDADGRQAGNLVLGRQEPGEAGYAHQSVRFRFDLELVNRNGARYAERLALAPPVAPGLASPLDSAFSVLLDSLACVDEVLTADAELIGRLGLREGDRFLQRADEYYILFDRRVGELCVQRLQAGIGLSSGLVRAAWEEAGAPTSAEIHARRTPADPVSTAGENTADGSSSAGADRFVGSRTSTIFHRADCRHVRRISPGNRVYFETASVARQQGRRPCRTCQPADGSAVRAKK